MHEFFTVEYEYRSESDNCYVAVVRLWIKADEDELLPKCYVN